MLTLAVPSPKYDADAALLNLLGLKPRPAFKDRQTDLPRDTSKIEDSTAAV